MKRTRAEMIKLPEHTQVFMNNWPYTDKRDKEFVTGPGIISSWLMTQRNDKQLKEIFGKCSFASNDWEYYTRVWIRDYKGETYLIYSSEKGTSYEMVVDEKMRYRFNKSESIGDKLIEFTDYLIAKMKALESNQKKIALWQKLEDDRITERNSKPQL